LALLALGDLAQGWRGYARRFEDPRFPFIRREWPWPGWKGEDLSGRTILLWGDQGIGDEILYSGMIREVARQAGACTVECAERLESLYRRSFPDIEIVARTKKSQTMLGERKFDFHCSVLDLGRWLRPRLSAFPNRAAVLSPDVSRAAELRQMYRKERRDTTLVGLSWRSANPAFGSEKSAPLDAFSPLFKNPELTFVNVQYGDTADEVKAAEKAYGICIRSDPNINALRDLDALSAQLAALDFVVTVSNTTAHLAAALGVPTWLYVPDGRKRLWYWFDRGHYSPWYRSVWICRDRLPDAMAALSASPRSAELR
jgi:hypothetical protein